jgi:hypothetical protein
MLKVQQKQFESKIAEEQIKQLFKLINGFKSEKFIGKAEVDQLSLFASEVSSKE